MRSARSNLDDAHGCPELNLSDIKTLGVNVHVVHLLLCSKSGHISLWIRLQNFAAQRVSKCSPTEDSAIGCKQEAVESSESHLRNEALWWMRVCTIQIK